MGYYNPHFWVKLAATQITHAWHRPDLPLEMQVKLTLIVLGHNYSKSVFVMTKSNDYNSQNNPNSNDQK